MRADVLNTLATANQYARAISTFFTRAAASLSWCGLSCISKLIPSGPSAIEQAQASYVRSGSSSAQYQMALYRGYVDGGTRAAQASGGTPRSPTGEALLPCAVGEEAAAAHLGPRRLKVQDLADASQPLSHPRSARRQLPRTGTPAADTQPGMCPGTPRPCVPTSVPRVSCSCLSLAPAPGALRSANATR